MLDNFQNDRCPYVPTVGSSALSEQFGFAFGMGIAVALFSDRHSNAGSTDLNRNTNENLTTPGGPGSPTSTSGPDSGADPTTGM